jgi:hypothetical protein
VKGIIKKTRMASRMYIVNHSCFIGKVKLQAPLYIELWQACWFAISAGSISIEISAMDKPSMTIIFGKYA